MTGMLWAAGLLLPLLPHFLELLAIQDGCFSSSSGAKGVCVVLPVLFEPLSFNTGHMQMKASWSHLEPTSVAFSQSKRRLLHKSVPDICWPVVSGAATRD